jgi:hypothetical protein
MKVKFKDESEIVDCKVFVGQAINENPDGATAEEVAEFFRGVVSDNEVRDGVLYYGVRPNYESLRFFVYDKLQS